MGNIWGVESAMINHFNDCNHNLLYDILLLILNFCTPPTLPLRGLGGFKKNEVEFVCLDFQTSFFNAYLMLCEMRNI